MQFQIIPSIALLPLNLKRAFRIFVQGWMLFFLVGMCEGQTVKAPNSALVNPIANFTDVAERAGLTMQNIFGGIETKKYIIETTGTGVAIFDYDNDGWPDIFLVNGTRLERFPSGDAPSNHLYRNNHDGTFTDVTVRSEEHTSEL